ncbi:MAG: T9SS type A sorting domain-containing protein [Lewinellaceae bacterium]|nr:T9SS type A sorting domain-containing protein [Saprospiraceae bacterium]MCB9336766.1 T9SS type A sorting domain-containing protein [Lewinellaceae bacterium]
MKKILTAVSLSLLSLNLAWSQYTLSGTITTEQGLGVQGVYVSADPSGTIAALTDADGNYQLQVPAGSNVTIAPFNNMDPLNGVSTYDYVLITRHIDGIELLSSPYKIIAADVNNSGGVDMVDTMDIRNLILYFTPTFPNNTSWRFVDKSYVFPNPANPFAEAWPEVIQLNNVGSDMAGLDFVAVKTGDVNGSAFPVLTPDTSFLSKITGHVFYDVDENCAATPGETPLRYRSVKAVGAGSTFYGVTQASGFYTIYLPQGTYDVSIEQPNGLWHACNGTVNGVSVPYQGSATVDFAEQAVQNCPLMSVDLSTWGIRRCFTSPYVVEYCNEGTETAENAYVEITLDSFFENVNSSIPWSSVDGHTYTFELGDVAVGECGSFQLHFLVSCDAVLGQTHCSYAHIYPDDPCLQPSALWSGADLLVTGECAGDNVIFTITNQGEDMTEPVPYVVIEDIMIQMTGNDLQLENGQSTTITAPANGSTWRLQSAEAGHHPYETFASASVEGCGTNGSGTFSLGFVNQFPLPDEALFDDIDCQENTGAFDPNDKTGYPNGYTASHFIEQGQAITYRLRFQNTGTDTAFNVLVVDTLPEYLDPATLRLNGSSHPLEYDLDGHGVAKFRFPNIMLPDSNVNEAASHGFVKFTISQKPDLALGTVIENEAGIYFDFNDPVITNRTWHTIGEDMVLEVTDQWVFRPGVEVQVFPNPFETTATFRLKGLETNAGTLSLYDRIGRRVKSVPFIGNEITFNGSGLAKGMYFYKIEAQGAQVATGKIMVK